MAFHPRHAWPASGTQWVCQRAERGGRVRADPATGGQLAAQVTAGVATLPLPMKPKLVLAPAPRRPL